MEFLAVIGAILFTMALALKNKLKWTADENSCNVEREEKAVRNNKIAWNISFYGGLALLLIGIIGIIL